MKKILKLNEELNNLKFIQVNDGFVVVDDSVAETGKPYWGYGQQKVYIKQKGVIQAGDTIVFATPNLKLEGVPEIGKKKYIVDNGYKCKQCGDKVPLGGKCKDGCSMLIGNLIIDYYEIEEQVQQNLFTEEQIKLAITSSWMMGQRQENNLTDCIDLIIQSLKQPKVEIEFDENGSPIKATLL